MLMFLNSVSLSYFTTWHHCNFSFELEKAVCSKVMSTAGVSEKSKSLHWAHLLSWVSVTAVGPLHTFLVIYKRKENYLQGISSWHTADNASISKTRKQWKNPELLITKTSLLWEELLVILQVLTKNTVFIQLLQSYYH